MTTEGVYEHYKGGRYRVLFIARNSTNGHNEGQPVIVYVSLTTGSICVRYEAEFNSKVMSPPANPNAPCWCDARGMPSCERHPYQTEVLRFRKI